MNKSIDKLKHGRDLAELRRRLDDYMARKGLRSTTQRRLVTEAFFRTPGHLSIEELLQKVRKKDPKVGYATVYRTMKMLWESGSAHERHFGDGVTRYELAHEDEHHDHIICLDCGTIVEFENSKIEEMQERLVRDRGFILSDHKLELYCHCELAATECPRRPKRA